MTADELVRAVTALGTPEEPLVTGAKLKPWFDQNGIDWGYRHGWPIRGAGDEEFARPCPRLTKWKQGRARNARVAFSLAERLDVHAPPGWHQERP